MLVKSVAGSLGRRQALLAGGATILGLLGRSHPSSGATRLQTPGPAVAGQTEWISFLTRYVRDDGRVVDTGNGGISHSEGQGVGMLCAATFGDETSFRLIHDWTERHLVRSCDALHSWRFCPDAAVPVSDENNATDGDLLIGLAMLLAGDRWNNADYRRKGLAVARCVRAGLLSRTASGLLLLPGVVGFTNTTDITVNPSYYVFPALQRFARELPDPIWQLAIDDGLAFLARARFGPWQLSPDWATVPRLGGDLHPAGRWPKRCSFDAVRVPLYLCWGGLEDHPAVAAFADFWAKKGGVAAPAWADLSNGAQAPYQMTSGMDAIRQYTLASLNPAVRPHLKLVAQAADYYSAALTMLVHVGMASNAARQPRFS